MIGPCKIFFLCRKPREFSSELLLIKPRNAYNVSDRRTDNLRRCNNSNLFIVFQHLCKYTELSGAVMVRCSSHDNHEFANFRQLINNPCCSHHFVRISYRSDLLLMEHITADTNQIRLFFLRLFNHIFQAFYCIQGTEIHSVLNRTFKLANVPVSCMQYFHYISLAFFVNSSNFG